MVGSEDYSGRREGCYPGVGLEGSDQGQELTDEPTRAWEADTREGGDDEDRCKEWHHRSQSPEVLDRPTLSPLIEHPEEQEHRTCRDPMREHDDHPTLYPLEGHGEDPEDHEAHVCD